MLCQPLAATIIPGPLYSGDTGGYNTVGPNYVVTDAQVGLTLPDGVTPVSSGATGTAAAGLSVGFVDQWTQTTPGEISGLDWWSSGPVVIWLDGGLGGIVTNDPGTGEQSGVLDFSALGSGPHYFVAYVTAADDGTVGFAYSDDTISPITEPTSAAPEPGTWGLVAGGILIGLAWKVRQRARVA